MKKATQQALLRFHREFAIAVESNFLNEAALDNAIMLHQEASMLVDEENSPTVVLAPWAYPRTQIGKVWARLTDGMPHDVEDLAAVAETIQSTAGQRARDLRTKKWGEWNITQIDNPNGSKLTCYQNIDERLPAWRAMRAAQARPTTDGRRRRPGQPLGVT